MKFSLPVSEQDLERNYQVIMSEIDSLSLQRVPDVIKHWPEFVESAGSWECLRDLHVMLFGGLFTFAGEFRTRNISKGGFRFANCMFLESNVPLIAAMSQKTFDEILAKYIEMNIAHPFREGNGRAMRLWLDATLERELDTRINWQKISSEEYLSAMSRSPVNSLELAVLLKSSFIDSDSLSDNAFFMSCVSASYSYEL